jgi:flagellar biosynthesis protein FlhG
MPVDNRSTTKAPKVWAIGGGKGGVGKSVITASLGVHLAGQGSRCVLLDADLGGANLHTMLGIPSPGASLADLFRREVAALADLLVPTPVPNLQLISSAGGLPDMANPKHAQKLKIIRQIFTLEADHVLLDLGAGSSFNVLDFFLAAHLPVLVVAPTPTSVENAYHFLKAVFFRRLREAIRRAGATRVVGRLMEEKLARGIRSPRDLVEEVTHLHPASGQAIAREIQAYSPRLLVNQTRREEEADLGRRMAFACEDYFGIRVEYAGAIRHDDRVHYAVQMKKPVVQAYPQTPFSVSLREICGKLLGSEDTGDARERLAGQ